MIIKENLLKNSPLNPTEMIGLGSPGQTDRNSVTINGKRNGLFYIIQRPGSSLENLAVLPASKEAVSPRHTFYFILFTKTYLKDHFVQFVFINQ